MGNDEKVGFPLPFIPYFYHDIVARIIPGMIQLGLIAVLNIYHSTEGGMKLNAVLPDSQVAIVLMLLVAAYFVGVIFECSRLGLGGLYNRAFSHVLAARNLNSTTQIGYEEAARLAEETSSILESYEPLVPHFFARATRFLAEAKMMFFSALAIPIAVVVVGVTTEQWGLPGGCRGFALGFILILAFVVGAYARQRRRAVEILRCVRYLADSTKPGDENKRAQLAWTLISQPLSQETFSSVDRKS